MNQSVLILKFISLSLLVSFFLGLLCHLGDELLPILVSVIKFAT